ncbi:MBL fold metallo-hydrolase [Massilia sp. TSP1-1-2]|uniref:MBL fold metallo-hydrolase n=1 Tax=Massilia sp. TSP1-1-2 TaxID=2804649 RepID=UPI003CEE646D
MTLQITQLRNATIIIHSGAHHILVDPMLGAKYSLPPLRVFDGKRERNPILDLPPGAAGALEQVTHCLITHCQKGHFDHLDYEGRRFLRERRIPVTCTAHDAGYLARRGLDAQPLAPDSSTPQPFLNGTIQTVRCTHGRGWIGALMEHGVGYLIALPGEGTLYLAGDTILSSAVCQAVERYQPDICVVPAGGARMDLGGEIIMGPDEVIAFAKMARGTVVANHLEALSHCPPTRAALAAAAQAVGVGARLRIPADGERLSF